VFSIIVGMKNPFQSSFLSNDQCKIGTLLQNSVLQSIFHNTTIFASLLEISEMLFNNSFRIKNEMFFLLFVGMGKFISINIFDNVQHKIVKQF